MVDDTPSDAPTETPDEKAARLRARKAANQRQRRSRPKGMSLYKAWAWDAHVEAILEWRGLLDPMQERTHAQVEAALEKLIATLKPMRVTGDSADPNFPAI
jgi:hypothetical protein